MSRADRYLKACKKESVDCTPVWIMRQAGRYLEEYRAVRAKHSFIEVCKTPELVVEITLQPIRRFELDAAIIFADILLPLEKMGIDFEFTKGDGPRINNTVRTRADVAKMRAIDPMEEMAYLMDAIRMVKRELNGRVPLIGFSGAPFTLASYITEGGGSRNYVFTKSMMYREPDTWHLLMEKLTDMVIVYLNDQIKAGVQAVQVFDSWVGCLSPADYREFVLPHQKRLMASLDAVGAAYPLRLRRVASAAARPRGRRRCARTGLAHGYRRGMEGAGLWALRSRETSTRSPSTVRGSTSSGGCGRSWSGWGTGTATSSTSGTASCPPRRPTT